MGFMGSGKSSVGSLLAEGLGWSWVDLDREVERELGRTIPEIFREEGEEAFREVEHRVAERALGREEVVIAPGGGWPCREGRMEALGPETLTIWLRVSADRAVERAANGGEVRPLLAVDEPLARARGLLQAREQFYRKAGWQVDTDERTPEEVVGLVRARLEEDPGRPLLA